MRGQPERGWFTMGDNFWGSERETRLVNVAMMDTINNSWVIGMGPSS